MSPANNPRKPRQNHHRPPGAYPTHDSPCPSSHALSARPLQPPLVPSYIPNPISQATLSDPPPLTYAQVAAAALPPLAQMPFVSGVRAPNYTHDRMEHPRRLATKPTLKRPSGVSDAISPAKRAASEPFEPISSLASAPLVASSIAFKPVQLKDRERIEGSPLNQHIRHDKQRRIIPEVPHSLDRRMERLSLKDECSAMPILCGVNDIESAHCDKEAGRPASPTLDHVRRLRANDARKASPLLNHGRTGKGPVEKQLSTNLDQSEQTHRPSRKQRKLDDARFPIPTKETAVHAPAKPKGTEGGRVSRPDKNSEDLESALRDISLFQGLPSKSRLREASAKRSPSLDSKSATTTSSMGLVTLLAQPGSDNDAEPSGAQDDYDDFEHVEVPEDGAAEIENEAHGRLTRGWRWFGSRK